MLIERPRQLLCSNGVISGVTFSLNTKILTQQEKKNKKFVPARSFSAHYAKLQYLYDSENEIINFI